MSRTATAAGGFTLIELIVALAVLSMLSLLVLQALSLAHRAWARGSADAAQLDEVGTVQQALRRRLELLLPLQDAAACGGSASELSFLARSADAGIAGGTERYRLTVQPAPGGSRLAVEWCPASAAPDCGVDAGREVLLDGIDGASIAYYRRGADGGGWTSKWDDCSDPPALIRIAVQFTARDRRVWPEFDAAPGFGAASDCVFDLVALKCRRA